MFSPGWGLLRGAPPEDRRSSPSRFRLHALTARSRSTIGVLAYRKALSLHMEGHQVHSGQPNQLVPAWVRRPAFRLALVSAPPVKDHHAWAFNAVLDHGQPPWWDTSMRGRAVQATGRPQYAARNGSGAVVNPSTSLLSRRLLPELRPHEGTPTQESNLPTHQEGHALVGLEWARMPQNISCRLKSSGVLGSFNGAELFVPCGDKSGPAFQ